MLKQMNTVDKIETKSSSDFDLETMKFFSKPYIAVSNESLMMNFLKTKNITKQAEEKTTVIIASKLVKVAKSPKKT